MEINCLYEFLYIFINYTKIHENNCLYEFCL